MASQNTKPSLTTDSLNTGKTSFLASLGWWTTFGLIPLGSCMPGFVILFIERIRQIVINRKSKSAVSEQPPLALWVNRLFLILFGAMILSGIFSPKPLEAILYSAGFGLIFYVFVFGSQSLGQKEELTEKYLPLLGISSVIAAIIALIRYFVQNLDRATNIPTNSWNGFGTTLIMVSGITVGYLAWRGGRWRYLILPYLALIIATLLATKSRGGWFGFLTMLGCLSLFKRKLILIFICFLIIIVLAFSLFPPLMERLTSSKEIISRTFIWRSTLNMIKDHPWLGIGNGIYPQIYGQYVLPGAPESNVSFSHNLFLQVTVELGVAGLLIFCALLGLIIIMNFSLAKTGHPLYQGIFASIIGVLVHQQVDLPIWGLDIGGAFWMVIGISIGLYCYEFQMGRIPARTSIRAHREEKEVQ